MDRKTHQSESKNSLAGTKPHWGTLWRAVMVASVAILVISGRVASAETDQIQIPLELANKLRPAITHEGALDTPFFNATQEEITISALKGRGVVLNFWATWCAPCVREMPALDRLAAQLKEKGVDVIAVSEDRKALKKVPPFFAANQIQNLAVYYDDKGNLSRKLGVEGLPTTILISADGQVSSRVLGVLEWDSPDTVAYLAQSLGPK